jgi:putative flippase GtrA
MIFGHPLWQKHGNKFLRFAVCGGFGACIDFGTLTILVHFLKWPEKYALLVSTGLAMIFVFFANRFFTFKAAGNTGNQAAKFLAVYAIAAFLNYTLSLTFIYLGVHYLLAKALAISFIMFFNYFSLNGFVFKQKSVSDEIIAV